MPGVVAHPNSRQGLHDWLAVVLAELRTLRRLARSWMFLAIGIALVATVFAYYSFIHATMSPSLNAGTTLPRFTAGYFSSYMLWFFMAALVFLAFDMRHRDERERIAEVVDARPLSNVALVAGRLAAVVLSVLVPLFAVLLLVQGVGTVGRALGWGVHPLEPVATFTFFFLDAVPALTLWCAVVLLLAAGLRNRLIVAMAALVLIGLHMWSFAVVPSYLLPALSFLYIHDNWASDLAPRLPDALIALHRLAMLALATALVVWAATLHARADDRPGGRRLLLGGVLAALAVAGIGTVVLRCIDGVQLRESWLTAHRAVAEQPIPRIERIGGQVRIDPGDDLQLELDIVVAAVDVDLPKLLFSFNPGLNVAELRVGGTPTPFRHEQGLLVVEPIRPLIAGSPAGLTIRASGVPDPDFAYIDSVVDWRQESSRNALLWLGTAAGIFEKRYVALLPGLRWLPVPGANLDDAHRGHAPPIDLTVEVPDTWLVAGPGRRDDLGTGRYRFRSQTGVPGVGLFAARFERRAMTVAGIELELLLHPAHLRNLDYYASTSELLRSRLEQVLGDAADAGLPYPYGGFSIVEVPAHLRDYGGGDRLATRMELPGLLLLKEQGFPFANVWTANNPDLGANMPGGFDAWKFQWLEYVFGNHAPRAFSRNIMTHQAVAHGPGARAMEYVCEELARLALANPRSSLASVPMSTAHTWNIDAGFGSTIIQMIGDLARNQGSEYRGGFLSIFTGEPSVWERALGASLADMDFGHDPGTAVRAFALRADAVTRSIFHSLGRDRTTTFLATLRSRGDGTYNADDFVAALAGVDADIHPLIGNWLTDVGLPGFIVSRASVERVADDDQGRPRYETRVQVRNGEPSPGLVRLGVDFIARGTASEPIRVEGNSSVEIGIVTAKPPGELWLHPYLALNRVPVLVALAEVGEDIAEREPLVGSRPSTWLPPTPTGIVIDDLDPGFSVEHRRASSRFGGATAGTAGRELDQGLPTWSRQRGEWTRGNLPAAWGKYRQTSAGSTAGDGDSTAVFSAELPTPGRWQLYYHVPNRFLPGQPFAIYGALGSVNMALGADGKTVNIDFDGTGAEAGWNKVGEYEFNSTSVRLEISSRTDGEMVVADAIRWAPVN